MCLILWNVNLIYLLLQLHVFRANAAKQCRLFVAWKELDTRTKLSKNVLQISETVSFFAISSSCFLKRYFAGLKT